MVTIGRQDCCVVVDEFGSQWELLVVPAKYKRVVLKLAQDLHGHTGLQNN